MDRRDAPGDVEDQDLTIASTDTPGGVATVRDPHGQAHRGVPLNAIKRKRLRDARSPSRSPRQARPSAGSLSARAMRTIGSEVEQAGNQEFLSKTCLGREWVQKEIRWARQYNKNIVVLYEADHRRPGLFDHAKARASTRARSGNPCWRSMRLSTNAIRTTVQR